MTYDPSTISRLSWFHGERAASIIAGTDEATNADQLAWLNIGGSADVISGLGLARSLVRQGESVEDAAEMAGIAITSLRNSLVYRPI